MRGRTEGEVTGVIRAHWKVLWRRDTDDGNGIETYEEEENVVPDIGSEKLQFCGGKQCIRGVYTVKGKRLLNLSRGIIRTEAQR